MAHTGGYMREERAGEAKALVEELVAAGWSKDRIAAATGVNWRTIYRWLNEGRAPHPVLLGALRGMARQGVQDAGDTSTG